VTGAGALAQSCPVLTFCLSGARAVPVEMEVQYTGGLMQRIVFSGLPGGAVREGRDRIRACLERCGLPVPRRSVLVNFAPADLPKDGNGFDLPLAIGLLVLEGALARETLAGRAIVGELALDGRLRPVRGALLCAMAARTGTLALLLPRANGAEAALVEGLVVEAVADLPEALAVLNGRAAEPPPPPRFAAPAHPDLADVRGQPSARRALEIAAAGRHTLLLCGPPGTGKTMLAQRLPGLLPPLEPARALAVSALHGLLSGGPATLVRHPPFRAPHHTVTRGGLIGAGSPPRPGELSLAHGGVLFLDELAEFPRALLETLRQPREERVVRIARASGNVRFPADVQLVGAMNPCPCGYLGHPRRGCRCTPHQLEAYRRRLSGPLLDRFDLYVEVPAPAARDLLSTHAGEASAVVGERVAHARARLAELATRHSDNRTGRTPRALRPAGATRTRFERTVTVFGLSGRAVERVLAVAATIAALAGRDRPDSEDLDEALSFRLGLLAFNAPA
jgi:magnesium chelatase family protein